MESAVNGSDAPPTTVKVAVPVTTVLLGLVAMAVMVVVPLLSPVASPPGLIVATWALLESQVAVAVRFCVDPDTVVPTAINWLVWPGDATDWEPGIIESEAKVSPPVPPLPLVTVIVAVAPVDPDMLAEIVVVPVDTAVASPVALTVATAGVPEVQVTWFVTS